MIVFDSQEAKHKISNNFKMKDIAYTILLLTPPSLFNQESDETPIKPINDKAFIRNPTALALSRAKELFPEVKEFLVVSLVTINRATDNLMEPASDHIEQMVINQKISLEKQGVKVEYIRIQSYLPFTSEQLSLNYLLLNDALAHAQKTIENHKNEIDQIVDHLAEYDEEIRVGMKETSQRKLEREQFQIEVEVAKPLQMASSLSKEEAD